MTIVSIMKRVDIIGKTAVKRRRRHHSAQFKAQVIEACAAPGVSVGAVAVEYGLNASLLRRWLKHSARGSARAAAVTKPTGARAGSAFVPVTLEATSANGQPIRIEVRRGSTTVNIEWPAQAAGACAGWLREWLR